MALTVYRRHYCGAKHRTYRTLAQCIWKRAEWIDGEGPYAVLAKCRKLTVTLHETVEGAEGYGTGRGVGHWHGREPAFRLLDRPGTVRGRPADTGRASRRRRVRG